jgi:hypothetical protein
MKTYNYELSNSWECYTANMVFINCETCAQDFMKEHNLEIKSGTRHTEEVAGCGVCECGSCGHEYDYPPSCMSCGAYLREHLTEEGRQYMIERLTEWPNWLVEYHLGEDYERQRERQLEAETSSHQVFINGALVGYHTRLGGLYICISCGHLCECGEEEEGN